MIQLLVAIPLLLIGAAALFMILKRQQDKLQADRDAAAAERQRAEDAAWPPGTTYYLVRAEDLPPGTPVHGSMEKPAREEAL